MADWDESEHPRHPAKTAGGKGGEFRPKGAKAVRDLATLSRSTLLKYARERGLVLPRGTDDDAIRQMIRRFDSGAEPDWIKRASEKLGKKAPAKKAPAKKFDVAEVAGRVSNAKTEREVIELLVSDSTLTAVRLRKVAEYLGFAVPADVRAKTSLQMLIGELEAKERKLPGGYQKAVRKPTPAVGVAFNSRKHPAGTRVVWRPEGEEPVYGTVGKMGRFTTIDWEDARREKVRAGVNHDDIRVVSPGEGREPDWAERISGRLRGRAVDDPPPFEVPPAPRPTREPLELYRQAVEFADAMNDMTFEGGPRFHTLPALTGLQRLEQGVEPREIWEQLEREAQTHPEEWGGGREYLNRLAEFIMLQATTLPPEESAARKARRARFASLAQSTLGDQPWRFHSHSGGSAYTHARALYESGKIDEAVEYLRGSASSFENRARTGGLDDAEIGALHYDDETRRSVALADARRLRKLADAIRGATQTAKLERQLEELQGRLGLARDRRRKTGGKIQSAAERRLNGQIMEVRRKLTSAKAGT